MPLAIALDLGTTSTAAMAVDEQGSLVRVVRRSHGADVPGLPNGHAEQYPQQHRQTAVDVLRELTDGLEGQPRCLGLTGQMHSVLPVDDQRRPLGHLITWQDRRANEPIDGTGRSYLDDYLARCRPDDLACTGCRLSPGYAAVTLFVLQSRGELPTGLSRSAQLADWIAAELADATIVSDRSHAASTGVYDLRHERWSSELIYAGGLSAEWFPPVVESGAEVGRLCQQFADATGLPAGLPVTVAIGDNQASVLGSVPQGEPAIQITIGTGGQINWPIDDFMRVDGMETRPLPPGRMMLVGAGLAGGDAFAWVQRTVGEWLRTFDVDRDSQKIYATLCELAACIPAGANGLSCEPFFRGTRREPLRRGTFTGIDTGNFTPGHIARAVLEGIATALHEMWTRAATSQSQDVRQIIGCGNGLEQNRLLRTILSETFDLPVMVPRHEEAAAYGAALLAGVAVGLWESLADASRGIVLGGDAD